MTISERWWKVDARGYLTTDTHQFRRLWSAYERDNTRANVEYARRSEQIHHAERMKAFRLRQGMQKYVDNLRTAAAQLDSAGHLAGRVLTPSDRSALQQELRRHGLL